MEHENIPEPSPEELADTLKKIQKDSEFSEPIFAEIQKVTYETAAQVGDFENIGDHSLDDVKEQLKADGWYFIGPVPEGMSIVNMGTEDDRETKIVGQGKKRYIFYRDKEVKQSP